MLLKYSNPTEISFLERLYYQHVNPALQLQYFYIIKLCYISRSLIASSSILQDSSHVVQAPVGVRCS
jgi:hypothetical protein